MLKHPVKKFHAHEKLLPYSDDVPVPAILASTYPCCKAKWWLLKANTTAEGKENEYLLREQCQVKLLEAILISVPAIVSSPKVDQNELNSFSVSECMTGSIAGQPKPTVHLKSWV